jgi:hypothetical protein
MSINELTSRGRQLFGFLLPGMIWITTGTLLAYPPAEHGLFSVDFHPSTFAIAAFIAGGYLVGYAISDIAKCFANHVHRPLSRLSKLNSCLIKEAALSQHVRCYLRDNCGGYPHLIDMIGSDPTVHPPTERDDDLFAFCKRYALEYAGPAARRDLEQREEEINLMCMLPLPLIAFAVAWVCSTLTTANNVSAVSQTMGWLVPLGLAICLCCPLKRARIGERIEAYEIFLLLVETKQLAHKDSH